jgi:hypothetical protein
MSIVLFISFSRGRLEEIWGSINKLKLRIGGLVIKSLKWLLTNMTDKVEI